MPFSRHSLFSSIRQWRIVSLTFLETSIFSRDRERYLDDEQFRLLQASLMTSPNAGVLIRGSGGLRKLRWRAEHVGKRGGLRIIYYHQPATGRIVLMAIYRKGQVVALSKDELAVLKKMIADIEQ